MTDSLPSSQQALSVMTAYLNSIIEAEHEKADKSLKSGKQTPEENQEAKDTATHDYSLKVFLERELSNLNALKVVSHSAKYMHSSAKSTGFLVSSNLAGGADNVISTGSLGYQAEVDISGNAALGKLKKFLLLDIDGQTVWQLGLEQSELLRHALTGVDAELAQSWMKALESLARPAEPLRSDTRTPQIYFPVGDDDYHLIVPTYPVTLANHLFRDVRASQFSDEVKAAKEARKKGEKAPPYETYASRLATMKLGGSKPQNVGQVIQGQYGNAYLLDARPPEWVSRRRYPFSTASVFQRYMTYTRGMRKAVTELAHYLLKTDYNNLAIREGRDRRLAAIFDLIVQDLITLQIDPSWCDDPRCRLQARELRIFRASGDYPELDDDLQALAEQCARWLVSQVRAVKRQGRTLTLDDAVFNEWRRLARAEFEILEG